MSDNKKASAQELDKKFEAGEDVSEHFDFDSATKKVNIDLPVWVVKALDQEAKRIGVPRQALMKMWLVARLDLIARESKSESQSFADLQATLVATHRLSGMVVPHAGMELSHLSMEQALIKAGQNISDAAVAIVGAAELSKKSG